MKSFAAMLLAGATAAMAQDLATDPYTMYDQRACAWSQFEEDSDWTFFAEDNDDPLVCAKACSDREDCTGFEVGPSTSGAYNNIMYCALWLNGNCNDEASMLHLGGYKAQTYVKKSALPTTTAVIKTTTTDSRINEEAELDLFEDEVEEGIVELSETLHEGAKDFEAAAATEPLLLFAEFEQRACAWSEFTENVDWAFASKTSDDIEGCARSCVVTEGCTGFEVGPSTSAAFDSISYCALWFHGACGDESNMLVLDSHGYVAKTYVLAHEVEEVITAEEETEFGVVEIEETEIFTPDLAAERYDNAMSSFTAYTQFACEFSAFREGQDWAYVDDSSDIDADGCAAKCLSVEGCTGFEFGTESHSQTVYCALWFNGACSSTEMMVSVPTSYSEVSTYLLTSYDGGYDMSWGVSNAGWHFIIFCAAALMLLAAVCATLCICCRVCCVACRRARAAQVQVLDINTMEPVVKGDLVQATVVRGVPAGENFVRGVAMV